MAACVTSQKLSVIVIYMKDKLKFNRSHSNLCLSDLSSCNANVSESEPQ